MKPPLTFPEDFYASQQFELQRIDYASPEAGGRLNGVQAGFPLWQGMWTIDTLGLTQAEPLRAFMMQLRGSQRRFLGCDILRPFPSAHEAGFDGMLRAGGGAFTGSATSWSETITADGDSEVTLTNLPAALTLSQGDYIGFSWTATEDSVAGLTWHAVVRVVEGGVADGSGDVTVVCEPPVPAAIPGTATAYLNNPVCVMALMPDKSNLPVTERGHVVRSGQIVGIQDIRA